MTEVTENNWELEANTDGLLFKPLTQEEREGIKRMVYKMAKRRFDALGLKKRFKVICDENNNKPEGIENGVINVSIVPEVERVIVEFFVDNTNEGSNDSVDKNDI